MKKILTDGEFVTYKIKSKIILGMLKESYKKKDIRDYKKDGKDGFTCLIDKETEEEIHDEEDRLKEFLFESTIPQSMQKLKRERSIVMLSRKIKNFNLKLFTKATKSNSVMNILNMAGIFVSWKISQEEL